MSTTDISLQLLSFSTLSVKEACQYCSAQSSWCLRKLRLAFKKHHKLHNFSKSANGRQNPSTYECSHCPWSLYFNIVRKLKKWSLKICCRHKKAFLLSAIVSSPSSIYLKSAGLAIHSFMTSYKRALLRLFDPWCSLSINRRFWEI